MDFGWIETVVIFGCAVALFLWGNAIEKRPVDLEHPRMVPPILVKSIATVTAILMLAHMITLGTGVAFRGGGM